MIYNLLYSDFFVFVYTDCEIHPYIREVNRSHKHPQHAWDRRWVAFGLAA
ncbi:MAG: hypothetical protein LIP08_13230 [Bacteroides sp.]|nr:hypothetical protein [Bacteroides sp.]